MTVRAQRSADCFTSKICVNDKELMRHASIQTTMNIYGKAMTDSKRSGSQQSRRDDVKQQQKRPNRRPQEAGRGYWELMGVCGMPGKARNLLRNLVAGEGFEPSTFGL